MDEQKVKYQMYGEDLKKLTGLSRNLYSDLVRTAGDAEPNPRTTRHETLFSKSYQNWYTEADAFLAQVVPSRLAEFQFLYQGDPKRRSINPANYTIRDFLLGVRLPARSTSGEKESAIALKKFRLQCRIFESAKVIFESILTDLSKLDSEGINVGSGGIYNMRFIIAASRYFEHMKKTFMEGIGSIPPSKPENRND